MYDLKMCRPSFHSNKCGNGGVCVPTTKRNTTMLPYYSDPPSLKSRGTIRLPMNKDNRRAATDVVVIHHVLTFNL